MNGADNLKATPKALIVDDETDICFLLGNILRQYNIQFEFAGTLAEAGRYLSTSHEFSYIFLDNHLPDGYGISMIPKVKAQQPEAKLVMITAHDTGIDREDAMRNGADYFVGKPFSKEAILKAIEQRTA